MRLIPWVRVCIYIHTYMYLSRSFLPCLSLVLFISLSFPPLFLAGSLSPLSWSLSLCQPLGFRFLCLSLRVSCAHSIIFYFYSPFISAFVLFHVCSWTISLHLSVFPCYHLPAFLLIMSYVMLFLCKSLTNSFSIPLHVFSPFLYSSRPLPVSAVDPNT